MAGSADILSAQAGVSPPLNVSAVFLFFLSKLLNYDHRRRVVEWRWLFTLSPGVPIANRRAIITARKVSLLLTTTRRTIARGGRKCFRSPAAIRPCPASSKMASLFSLVGAIHYAVEPFTTDGPCARLHNHFRGTFQFVVRFLVQAANRRHRQSCRASKP